MRFHILPSQEQISMTMKWVYDGGLTTTSGGNISIREPNGDIWVTPSGIDKGSLSPGDIVRVKPDGTSEGRHKQSSEFPSHIAIYEARADIDAIIHAHPPGLVSFSIVRKIPDTDIIPQAQHICGNVGYAPYRTPGSDELGQRIAKEFKKGHNSVIMENHGAVVGGRNLDEAFQRFETLEFCARSIIKTGALGVHKRLGSEQLKQFNKFKSSLPKSSNTEYPSDERTIRNEICRFVKRACRQKFMISTYGTMSARWRKSDFLITPTDVNRKLLQPEDIVQIKDGKQETGKQPSRAASLHQQIYRTHPHINCIITAQPPNISAFCVSGKPFDTHTIPESYVFLKDIPTIPFGSQLNTDFIPQKLSRETPILLIENDAMLITGQSILEAFDRLEVAEFSARSIINAASLGDIVSIGKEELRTLDEITS